MGMGKAHLEDWLELLEVREGRVEARVLVRRHRLLALLALDLHRRNLAVEDASLRGREGLARLDARAGVQSSRVYDAPHRPSATGSGSAGRTHPPGRA